MTTSVSTDTTSVVIAESSPLSVPAPSRERAVYKIRHSLASRFVFLVICVGIVMSALAFGTVHYWALSLFNLGALTILILWVIDSWQLGTLRVSRNLCNCRCWAYCFSDWSNFFHFEVWEDWA